MQAWFLSPYDVRRIIRGGRRRIQRIPRIHLNRTPNADMSWTEIAGDRCLAKVNAPDDELNILATVVGIQRLTAINAGQVRIHTNAPRRGPLYDRAQDEVILDGALYPCEPPEVVEIELERKIAKRIANALPDNRDSRQLQPS